MQCPGCFEDKGAAQVCPRCGFEEQTQRDSRFLPYRHSLCKGRYVVGQVLGNPGGFGVAYKALDKRQGALVVIKECLLTESNQVLRERDDVFVHVNPGFEAKYREWLDRFREEAGHISRFSSRNIVRVTAVFDENNTAYYAMPYVEGEDLGKVCAAQGGRLPEDEVVRIARQLLPALTEIHAQHVVHRDIKPSNILITKNKRKPVLIDFGAARDRFDEDRSRSHMLVHSPLYAPCEQILGSTTQGAWTDIYALCATLHRCLVGEPPPKSAERYDPQGRRPDSYVPLRERMPQLSPGLAALIDQGLALLPQQRLQSAQQALLLLGEEPPAPGPDPVAQPPLPPVVTHGSATLPAVETAPRPAAAPAWAAWAALLPAAGLVAYGLGMRPDFGSYITEWPGLLVLANLVAWGLWRTRRARPAAPAPPPAAATTTGLGPTVIEVPADQVVAVEVRLESKGVAAITRVVRPGETLVVGRTARSDLAIPNDLLSGRHVSITVAPDGEFELTDLDSRNHTYVFERRAANTPGAWQRIVSSRGRKGRYMLGPPEAGGVQLEIRQTTVAS